MLYCNSLVVLDFMVLSPLGAILMPRLNISTSQFGLVVSVYAFSAGAAGLCAAWFADRFDRKNAIVLLCRFCLWHIFLRHGQLL